MRCTARRTTTSAKLFGWLAVAAIATGALPAGIAQQTGAVPTDHYGPPACTAEAKPPAKSDVAERARNEQKEAVENSHIVLSDEPVANFGVERYKLLQYGDCSGDNGCYWADLDAQYKRAEAELERQLAAQPHARKRGERLAIVMDIDETTLANYCEMRREDFGYIHSIYRPWELSPESSMAIPGALRLFNKAREAGVAVFFISGRPGRQDAQSQSAHDPDETAATTRNLETAGFHGWAGLRLRNGEENHMPTIAFKTQERQKIVADGYRIIMSLGDQWSDLLGDPQADISIKLPNPFYFIP